MFDKVAYFISITETVDQYGDAIITPVEREVFVDEISIGQSEFYQAQAAGLKAEIKLKLADYVDYQGEKTVKYEGKEYQILRTYKAGTRLEITLKGDVNVGT